MSLSCLMGSFQDVTLKPCPGCFWCWPMFAQLCFFPPEESALAAMGAPPWLSRGLTPLPRVKGWKGRSTLPSLLQKKLSILGHRWQEQSSSSVANSQSLSVWLRGLDRALWGVLAWRSLLPGRTAGASASTCDLKKHILMAIVLLSWKSCLLCCGTQAPKWLEVFGQHGQPFPQGK